MTLTCHLTIFESGTAGPVLVFGRTHTTGLR